MSNNNKRKQKYYVKKDGIVSEINREEYNQVNKELMKENKKYLCPNCRVCTCEKIRYSDINTCEEVILATFKKTYRKVDDRQVLEKDFKVYDCNKFEMFRELVIRGELIIKSEILEISKKIYELLLTDDYDDEELEKLYELRDKKKEELHDCGILNELTNEEAKLYQNYTLQLKMQNEQK